MKRGQQPPPAPAGPEPDWDEDGDETYIRDASGRLVLAEWTGDGRLVPAAAPAVPAPGPAAAGELTVDDALRLCGWQLAAAAGGCQIVDHGLICGAETRWLITTRLVKDAWVCTRHYGPLAKLIATSWRK